MHGLSSTLLPTHVIGIESNVIAGRMRNEGNFARPLRESFRLYRLGNPILITKVQSSASASDNGSTVTCIAAIPSTANLPRRTANR